MTSTATRAVVFDFYGTLGESEYHPDWMRDLVRRHGYDLSPTTVEAWMPEAWDGKTHKEASVSEAAYRAWQHECNRAMLREAGVPEHDAIPIARELDETLDTFRMTAYPETHDVLAALRGNGLQVAVCSNWSWDLDDHLEETGIARYLHARVASAWVGARKPHHVIYDHVLRELQVDASEVVFVGDTWAADILGPLSRGMRPVHLARHPGKDGPDHARVVRIRRLDQLLDLL